MSGDGGDNRRHPHNIKGLLNFCTEVTAREDRTSASSFSEMDPERREWLSQVLSDMSTNPVVHLKECVQSLLKAGEGDAQQEEEVVESVLDELTEWCQDLDLAQDFHKIGGFCVFPVLLHSGSAEIRSRTLSLLATVVQNNPYCQQAALDEGLMPVTLELLDNDQDSTVRVKALYAVSCLAREMPEAQKVFQDHDGFSKVMRAMQSDVDKLKLKAAFMLTSMCTLQPTFKDILCDMGMVDQLVGHLMEPHGPFHEHVMSTLLTMVTDHPTSLEEACRPQLKLQHLLEQRLHYLHGKEEFQEEHEHAQQLLRLCFTDSNQQESTEANRVVQNGVRSFGRRQFGRK